MEPKVDVDPWAQAGVDAFLHADGHAVSGDPSDRRHAILGYDVAVEGTITGFLRAGPGLQDDASSADTARRPGAKFWPKAVWLVEYARRRDVEFPFSEEDVNRLRSIRNEVQHGGAWWVPDSETVESGRSVAVSVIHLLAGVATASTDVALPGSRQQREPRIVTGAARPTGRRPLVEAAWTVARQIDPDGEGVHFGHLAMRIRETGFAAHSNPHDFERAVYDALNHAHDLFRRIDGARGVWRWTERSEREPRNGLSGKLLGEKCYEVAQLIDPERRGISYSRELVPALLARGIEIRGIDVGAAVNRALIQDPRFTKIEGRSGVYRWS